MVLTLFNPSLFFIGSDIPLLPSKFVLTLKEEEGIAFRHSGEIRHQRETFLNEWDLQYETTEEGEKWVSLFGNRFLCSYIIWLKTLMLSKSICLMQNKLCMYWFNNKVHTAIILSYCYYYHRFIYSSLRSTYNVS